MSVSRMAIALVVVGGAGLMWPKGPLADPGLKVWDASDGKPEPQSSPRGYDGRAK
jgi:hypothetical protein